MPQQLGSNWQGLRQALGVARAEDAQVIAMRRKRGDTQKVPLILPEP